MFSAKPFFSLCLLAGLAFNAGCGLASSRGEAESALEEDSATPASQVEDDVGDRADVASSDGSSGLEAPMLVDAPKQAGAGAEGEALTTCFATVIDEQADIDALEGCQVIRNSLGIVLPYADLRPLHALQVVEGSLGINGASSPDTGERDYAISVASLEGLENLVRVGQLMSIDGTAVSSLTPLSKLRKVGRLNDSGFVDGGLHIYGNPNLRDLTGLEALELDEVVVDVLGNERLESLRPLVFPRQMFGRLLVRTNPMLADLGSIEALESLEYLTVSHTLLENLDVLSNLRRATIVQIHDNPRLVDAEGLARLEATEWFSVTGHPQLAQLPEFEQMTSAGLLMIWNNDILRSTPLFPQLTQLAGGWAGHLDVQDNAALEQIRGPFSLEVADRLTIERNPNLVSVSLPRLRELRESLVVISNPQLEESTHTSLLSLGAPYSKVGGNQPDWMPLDPCPWSDDWTCDESSSVGLCAEGTDSTDCSSTNF